MPTSVCTACAHPDRAAIDAALAAGKSVRSLAALHGLSKSVVWRHRPHALGHGVPPVPPDPAVPPEPGQPEPTAAGTTETPPDPAPDHRPKTQQEPSPNEPEDETAAARTRGSTRLSPRQERAAIMLAAGYTQVQVARDLGVDESSIRRWQTREPFKRAIRVALERSRQAFEGRLFALAGQASVVVQRMLTSPKEERQAHGAKLVLANAARLAARYKELQVEGYTPPPMFLLPVDHAGDARRGLRVPGMQSQAAHPPGCA